jgi:hypothetical protein
MNSIKDYMEDSLKTSIVGLTGAAVTGIGILPDIVSVGVGVLTGVYLVLKIRNELSKKE